MLQAHRWGFDAGMMVLDSKQEQPVAAFAELFKSSALPSLMQACTVMHSS